MAADMEEDMAALMSGDMAVNMEAAMSADMTVAMEADMAAVDMAAHKETDDALNVYWGHFFKAETGTYEKSTWLDLFLAEFLIRVKDGANPKELIKFCPVSGVVSLVGCELLCGVHRVTSSINSHYAPPGDAPAAPPAPPPHCSGKEHQPDQGDDTKSEKNTAQARSMFSRAQEQRSGEILRKYLVGGVPGRALALLRALGVEGLSCCRQLSSVLIWLFGELSESVASPPTPATTRSAAPSAAPSAAGSTTPIHQLFSHKIWSKQKVSGNLATKVDSAASSEKGYVTGRSRRISQIKSDSSDSKAKKKHHKHSEHSSESGDSNEDLHILNRLTLKVSSPDDFHYFDSPVRSNEFPNETLYTDPYYTPRKPKPRADDYITDRHREVINSEITTFEFTILITDLLRELCKTESSLSGSEGSLISVQCINFSLRNLCSLQFGSLPSSSQDSEEVSSIKVALTELLIVSLDKVLIHSDLCAKLINNGILPMLLRILEDVVCKSSGKYKDNRAKLETTKTESENLLKFVFGIAYSITAFFHCLLMQCRSIEKLREFTDQFKLYGECLKGGLLKECIELMIRIPEVRDDSVILIKKLIESISKLISGMKRIRSEVVHSAACPRTRHKVCRQRVAAGMHHHHDILGEAGTGLPLSSACCVSVLYGTLTSLAADEEVSAETVLRSKILRVMLNCGVCCCFSPGSLMESVVRLMLTHNSVASLCLQVLEHTVYGELGAGILVPKVTDQLPCSICEPSEDKRDLIRKYCPHGAVERRSVWSFLIHYNSLLQLDNHNNVLHATVSHLLRVTPRCREEMKYELLFSVIYPTFIVAKHRYIIRLEESAYFLTVSCLNIFASLLNTVSFAEQFIQKGGLSYVLELVSLSEFSNQCCSILEIAIIVEIFKLMRDSDITYCREISSLASVQMLFKSLSEVTDKCYKIFRLKLPEDRFEELCDVRKERESLAFMPAERAERARTASLPQAIRGHFASSEIVIEDSIEDYLEILKDVHTFWKSCACLCLYSPMFREHVVGRAVFVDSYALLKLVLHCVCAREGGAGAGAHEHRVLIALAEALLTVQFAVSDVTSGRSAHTSCALVRGALVAPPEAAALAGAAAGGGAGAGGELRALCEALIRVCVAEPSRHHAMPRLAALKVPPLGCSSGTSSVEGSASEDSAAGPYASEHSDPRPLAHPDTGYEADVEIGKLDITSSQKSRKMSGSLVAMANLSGGHGAAGEVPAGGAQCAEYAPQGELAHPELCVIVVDILTQLIHRLLTSPQSGGEHAHMGRVGACLARACCVRLSGALARARAAPPQLLRRLLAPNAAPLLTHKHHHLQDLQRSILELIHVVASQSIEPWELAAFLRLFLSEAPPLALLLGALQRLVAAAQPNTPDCILTFPIDSDTAEGVQSLSEELNFVMVNSSSQSQQAESCARRLQDAHTRAGIRSPWSMGAARCGVEGAGWAPWLQGFALVLWLRTAPAAAATTPTATADRHGDDWETTDEWRSETHEAESPPKRSPARREADTPAPAPPRAASLSHVLSVGHDSLMFELWLDTNTGSVTYRLSRPEPLHNKVVGEASVVGALPPHRWSCVALNVRELVQRRRALIQVTLYVNGYECETVSMPLQGILVRKATPAHVVVGHAAAGGAGDAGGAYHVSHAHVYRAPALSVYSALHLTAHGPDHACQVRCESPNFPLLLTPTVLDSNIDWDQVYEMSSASLRELHDALLLTFSAHAPAIMNLYHQTAPPPTVFSGRVASTASLMGAAAAAPTRGAGAGASIPETLFAAWRGRALPSRHRAAPPALYMLGGPQVLLYLFARVVELEGSAEEQATALSVLLRACRADNRLYAALYGTDALDMVHTVLAAPHCALSHHLLKVILEEACGSPILTVSAGSLMVLARSDAVLLEPRLLVLLMRAWRHLDTTQEVCWETESGGGGARVPVRGSLWALALRCVCVLARDDHPRRAFNHYQMTRVGLLRHLLLACKERFLNSECGPLDASASGSLVELVRGLMGAPPLLDRLALLCDFLLLMHQASDTFVTHSRANFFFLLTPETPETSDFAHGSTKRRTARRGRRRGAPPAPSAPHVPSDLASSSSVTSEDVDYSIREEGGRLHQSGESTKMMKGIINTQIKEGRKHNISSTSETSDITIEKSGALDGGEHEDTSEDKGEAGGGKVVGGREGEKVLTEFIVVDEEDVNHTTVEMYSSGIYHQRRVRAGAAPGWSACEGLLLLLRDTIGVLPDQELAQAVCGAVQAESLVVLGNHRDAGVRAALLRVVAALQRRAPHHLAKRLRQNHYYLHLANQISLYPGSWELAAACAALLTKCDVPLEDQLDDDIWMDMREESYERAAPLLALLPCCVRDVPLAHNLTLVVRRLIDKASLKMLNEISIVEVVVRSLREVGLMGDAGFEGRDLLLEDLHELLNRVAIKALSSQHSMQTISEIHHMLTYVELSAGAGAGTDSAVRRVARDAQLALYAAQLDHLEERLHSSYSAHTKYTNYFSTVLSSAVSLGAEGVSRGERAELAARHLATVQRAQAFLLTLSPHAPATAVLAEAELVDRLFATLLPAVSGAAPLRPKWWVSVGADWVSPLQELFWWCASPGAGVRALQPRLLRALYHQPPATLQLLTPPDPTSMRKLAVYLLTILKHVHAEAESGSPPVERAITDWARGWAVGTQAGLPERLPSETRQAEAERLLQADLERWEKANTRQRAAIAKVIFSKEALASKLTESAMGLTRQVVDVQNAERKAFMEHLRRAQSEAVARAQRWRRLVDAHTHEHAVWHEARGYPQSWQLDATEGPGRVRVRLRRAPLRIPSRFLKPQHRHKAELGGCGGALRSVIGCVGGLHGGLVARLQLHETVAYMARVTYVTVASDTCGELLLSDRCIHFVPEDVKESKQSPAEERAPEPCSAAQSWPLEAVVQVATRRWCLQELAVEMFLSSGHAHLVAFADVHERTAFLKALSSCHLPSRMEADTLAEAMTQWRNGAITNWEYLMRLNGLGGRSYNDLMQYPVLPFVIAEYSARILDLDHPASFRDLAKPMAIQNKKREQHYIDTYNDLSLARREGCSALLSQQPHHYASLYSNSGGVLHYLVRLPPFTELFLNYQDNNFDMPDRTFHSLATTWRLITQDSPTDVKELIPELFYLPELFHNNEGLDLGVRQCGAPVDDVELPAWAADARLFTLIHRQALEAAHVTERLPLWIDLVFGYKQTGQPAIDAINVFPACTYYGFDPTALEDTVDRTAAAAMIRTYGQAPRQLLRHPHPHAAPDLHATPFSSHTQAVWSGVGGARWGRYCGSPALPPPRVASRRACPGGAGLHALPHARSVAVAARATALLALQGDPGAASGAAGGGGAGGALALLSWGHSDSMVRLKRRRDARPDLLLHVPAIDQISKVATSCVSAGCPSPVFVGHASGRVLAVRLRHDALGHAALAPRAHSRPLHAHRAAISDIHVCARAALLATASVDGRIVLWDLNSLSYIRTLPNRGMIPVTHVAISETLCDVASAHDAEQRRAADASSGGADNDDAADADSDSYEKDDTYKYKSLIRVHTVNARFVGSVKVSERVTCLCYSNAPEGVSVNCVAAGLSSGGVRLYSSWDLRSVAHIAAAHHARPLPLLSLTYSSDSSILFGCYADGLAVAWESGAGGGETEGAGGGGGVRILPAHAVF